MLSFGASLRLDYITRQLRIYSDDVLAYQIYVCKGCKLENEYNEVICVVS